MQREGVRKLQAARGLSGSGARTQSEISQNIATGGALTASKLQEDQQQADLDAQEVLAEQQRNYAIQQAEAGAEVAGLESDLRLEESRIAKEDARVLEEFDKEIETITQYRNDYTAEIERRLATPDTADDKLIPYLETAKQDKIESKGLDQFGKPLPVDRSEEIEDRAWKKINAGIPLNADEAAIFDVAEGYVKPKPVSSGSSRGLTRAQMFSNADKKVNRGIALTAEEAAIYGVEEGYVDPNFEGSTSEDEDVPEMNESNIDYIIDRMANNVAESQGL